MLNRQEQGRLGNVPLMDVGMGCETRAISQGAPRPRAVPAPPGNDSCLDHFQLGTWHHFRFKIQTISGSGFSLDYFPLMAEKASVESWTVYFQEC